MGKYSGNGGGKDVDVGATLERGPFQGKGAGGLRTDVQFHLDAATVWEETVKRLFAFGRSYELDALIGELMEKNLLGEFAGL